MGPHYTLGLALGCAIYTVKLTGLPYRFRLVEVLDRLQSYGEIQMFHAARTPQDVTEYSGIAWVKYTTKAAAQECYIQCGGEVTGSPPWMVGRRQIIAEPSEQEMIIPGYPNPRDLTESQNFENDLFRKRFHYTDPLYLDECKPEFYRRVPEFSRP